MSEPENTSPDTEEQLPATAEVSDEGDLEIPDLALGLIIGVQTDGKFYLHQLSQPVNPPVVDAMALKGMLELGLQFLDQMLSDTTQIGACHRLRGVQHVSEAIAKGLGTMAGDVASFRQLIANSQHTNAEMLRFINDLRGTEEEATNTEEKKEKETSESTIDEEGDTTIE